MKSNRDKLKKLQVAFDTAWFMGHDSITNCGYTVYMGSGTVWEKPTHGLPVLNPSPDSISICFNQKIEKPAKEQCIMNIFTQVDMSKNFSFRHDIPSHWIHVVIYWCRHL